MKNLHHQAKPKVNAPKKSNERDSSVAAKALIPSRHRDVYPFKYPNLGNEINLRIGVEDDRTCPAPERSIRKGRNVRVWADQSNRSGQRYHTLAGFEFGARPNVS
ncbi:hypothetical protein V6N13_070085 [Hibiscus sabdariffa]